MIPKIHGMENSCFKCVYVCGCDVINLTFFFSYLENLQFLSYVHLFTPHFRVLRHLKTYVLDIIRAIIKFSRKLPFKFKLLKLTLGTKFPGKIPMFNVSVDIAEKLYRIYFGILV